MDIRLKQDLEHFFSVFRNNTESTLSQLLPQVPDTKRYQTEMESELDLLLVSVLNRVEEEFRR